MKLDMFTRMKYGVLVLSDTKWDRSINCYIKRSIQSHETLCLNSHGKYGILIFDKITFNCMKHYELVT